MGKSLVFITVLIAWLVVSCESGIAPKIIRAFGDGVTEGNLVEKIVVLGEHFTEDCKAQLIQIADMGNPIDVSVQYISESELHVVLDSAIAVGSYSLEVANDFGRDSVSLTLLKGETGSTGLTGPTGQNGEIGPTGSRGYTGVPGTPGRAGDPGLNGQPGLNGENGFNGQNGVCWNSIKPEIESIAYNSTMYIGGGPYTITIFPNGYHNVTDLEFGLMTMYGSANQSAFPHHNEFIFTPLQSGGPLTFTAFVSDACQSDFLTFNIGYIYPAGIQDIDGNFYPSVTINGQVWMAENLKTTRYNNGSAIPNVTDGTSWGNLTTGAYCDYNNTLANADIYGRLYNWYAVNTGLLCPAGWHVPTDDEWTTLTTYLGGESVAGGKMKETGFAHWFSPNTDATNISGFTALPGGYRNDDGDFYALRDLGNWWSATADDATDAWDRNLSYGSAGIYSYADGESFGFSVRCVRD